MAKSYTNDELKGTQNQVLDISSLSKNHEFLLVRPDTRYIELMLDFYGKSYHRLGRIENLHNKVWYKKALYMLINVDTDKSFEVLLCALYLVHYLGIRQMLT